MSWSVPRPAVALEHHVAALAAVSAGRAPERDRLLASKRDCAVTAIARLDDQRALVHEVHARPFSIVSYNGLVVGSADTPRVGAERGAAGAGFAGIFVRARSPGRSEIWSPTGERRRAGTRPRVPCFRVPTPTRPLTRHLPAGSVLTGRAPHSRGTRPARDAHESDGHARDAKSRI